MKYFKILFIFIYTTVVCSQGFADINSAVEQNLDKNYVINGGFENAASGWKAYKNTAQSTPVTGTGGTPTTTITTSTSSPLAGKSSGLVTHTASNLQGEGVSYSFVLDNAAKGRGLTVSGVYQIVSGTYSGGSSTTDSDVEVFIYDVDGGTVIQPAGYKLDGGVSGINYLINSTFQTNTTSSNYRLILHNVNSTAAAFQLKIDSIKIGLQNRSQGPPVTDWAAYTPAITQGFTSLTNASFMWRRVGDSMEVQGRFTPGSSAAVEARIALPNGLTIDSNKLPTTRVVGEWLRALADNTGVSYYMLGQPGVSYLNIGAQDAGQNPINLTLANGATNSGQTAAFTALVPIQGWSSNVTMSETGDNRVVGTSVTLASNQAVAANGIVKYDTVAYDLTGSYSSTTGLYTCPVPGIYHIALSANITAGGANLLLYKNGVPYGYILNLPGTTLAGGAIDVQCNAGNTLSINSDLAKTFLGGTPPANILSISKISGSSQIATSDSVSASYTDTSGGSIPGSLTTYTYGTRIKDSHNMMSGNTYTIPLPGQYRITATLFTTAVSQPVGGAFEIFIYRNGVQIAAQFIYGNGGGSVVYSNTATVSYPCNAGDTIQVKTLSSTATTANTTAGSNNFSIERTGN